MYLLDITKELREVTIDARNDLDLIWGAKAIAKAIGRSERSVFGMLEAGELPAKRVKGRWVIERGKLIAFFTGEAA